MTDETVEGAVKSLYQIKKHGACQACRASKIKCSKEQPCCEACRERHKKCEYPPSERQAKRQVSRGLKKERSPTGSGNQVADEEDASVPLSCLPLVDAGPGVPDDAHRAVESRRRCTR
jgi:hypothetical protein